MLLRPYSTSLFVHAQISHLNRRSTPMFPPPRSVSMGRMKVRAEVIHGKTCPPVSVRGRRLVVPSGGPGGAADQRAGGVEGGGGPGEAAGRPSASQTSQLVACVVKGRPQRKRKGHQGKPKGSLGTPNRNRILEAPLRENNPRHMACR